MVNVGLMIAGILGAIVGIFLIVPSGGLGTASGSDVSSWGSWYIRNGLVKEIGP